MLRGVGNTSLPISWGFIVLDLPGRENHFQFISARAASPMGTKEKGPKLWMCSLGSYPQLGKGDKAGRDQSSCGWASQPRGESWQCPAPVGRVLLWRMDLLEHLSRMRVGSPSPQDLCPPRVYLTLNPAGILPTKISPPTPRVRAVGFSLSGSSLPRKTPQNSLCSLGGKHLCYPHLP